MNLVRNGGGFFDRTFSGADKMIVVFYSQSLLWLGLTSHERINEGQQTGGEIAQK